MPPWLVIILGYLLGCIPTAYVVGWLRRGRDIRHMGDTNPGAANTWRTLGPVAGIIVFLIDAAKGAAAVLIAVASPVSTTIVLLAGLAAVIGHNWPVFFGFRGGRGVSATLGILYVLIPVPMLLLTIPVLFVVFSRGAATPGMAVMFVMLPLVGWWQKVPTELILYSLGLGILLGLNALYRDRRKLNSASRHSAAG